MAWGGATDAAVVKPRGSGTVLQVGGRMGGRGGCLSRWCRRSSWERSLRSVFGPGQCLVPEGSEVPTRRCAGQEQ